MLEEIIVGERVSWKEPEWGGFDTQPEWAPKGTQYGVVEKFEKHPTKEIMVVFIRHGNGSMTQMIERSAKNNLSEA